MTSLDLRSNTSKVSQHRGYRITSRDLDILVAIYRFRFLTRQLVEWAFFSRADGDFDTRSSLAARRLQALYQAGYVQRLVLPGVARCRSHTVGLRPQLTRRRRCGQPARSRSCRHRLVTTAQPGYSLLHRAHFGHRPFVGVPRGSPARECDHAGRLAR